ncbi:hypothetical protein [Jannaschia sp. R86511]|uniref:hypothetical protein n=1 Tax=Jannaschia sp. R86511 TaxID=3093853 RepID=UPI0036D3C824
MTDTSALTRLLSHRLLPVALLAVVAAAGLTALVVTDDAADTVLGAVAGAATVLAVAAAVVQAVVARAERQAADRRALDGLEPLRAARRDDRNP